MLAKEGAADGFVVHLHLMATTLRTCVAGVCCVHNSVSSAGLVALCFGHCVFDCHTCYCCCNCLQELPEVHAHDHQAAHLLHNAINSWAYGCPRSLIITLQHFMRVYEAVHGGAAESAASNGVDLSTLAGIMHVSGATPLLETQGLSQPECHVLLMLLWPQQRLCLDEWHLLCSK
jgi:hypothetical protein